MVSHWFVITNESSRNLSINQSSAFPLLLYSKVQYFNYNTSVKMPNSMGYKGFFPELVFFI